MSVFVIFVPVCTMQNLDGTAVSRSFSDSETEELVVEILMMKVIVVFITK